MSLRARYSAFALFATLTLIWIAPAAAQADNPYSKSDPTHFDIPQQPPADMSYARRIQPILDRRCVVCHACYDAPCQLKATSWEGLARGANKQPVYDAARLLAASPSRLYVDAQKASEWRKRNFFSVLNEHEQSEAANRTLGLMHRMLTLKEYHPWPAPDGKTVKMDLSPDRANQCPTEVEIDTYEQTSPMGGMPFGLPGLAKQEQKTLTDWIAQGAPYEGPQPLTATEAQEIDRWEHFFNGDSLKEQLFSRYAYEHLFLAHLYFDDDTERRYFKLMRSSTPPGEPVRIIATARPVDDPGVSRVYYRLVPERETIVAKTHMPYRLDSKRMARWQTLFLTPDYTVDTLPPYNDDTAANPFATYAALPVDARYRFMLDEAEFTISGFIKGPVCRGQLALNVVDDQFWIAFLAPSAQYDRGTDALLKDESELMRLPTGNSNTALLTPWLRYGQLTKRYTKARNDLLVDYLKRPENLNLNLIWDGSDGSGTLNDNAGLTVFRHFDSASVVKGFVGPTPKTAWIMGYPLLERIHYLLVANYDVYGNVGHQTNSRLYMDYLRAEGEFNFLAFLPQAQRITTRDYWYRGVDNAVREQVYGGEATTLALNSGVHFKTADTRVELMNLLKKRLAPAIGTHSNWEQHSPNALKPALRSLAAVHGDMLQWIPETAVLAIDTPGSEPLIYTLLRNTAHASVSHLLGENRALLPNENTLSLLPSVVGSYPNAFYRVPANKLREFTTSLSKLDSEEGYSTFAKRWAVRRDAPDFWAFSDMLLDRYLRDEPIAGGILDYNRLEYR